MALVAPAAAAGQQARATAGQEVLGQPHRPGAEAGRPQSLGRLSAPAYAGELGLLGRMPRTATVTCAGPCAVYRIDGEDFLDALTTTPLSPSALGLAQVRLARTHPTRRLPDR